MSDFKYVFDGTGDNFRQLVIENSSKGPVLVNYWTPNAGPCFKLWEVLKDLSEAYQGRFLLVNVNTETQKTLVREHGITSVPTVKLYHQGAAVESIYGAQSESALRQVIDKYAMPAHNSAVAKAIQAYQAGQVDQALVILVEAATREPHNTRLHATAIKLLLREQRYADIERYIAVLPDSLRRNPDISIMQVHGKMLDLARIAEPIEALDERLAQTPGDSKTAISRAAVAMISDDYATALDHLLRIFRQDRHYQDGLAHKAMQLIFSILGEEHELVRNAQKAVRENLH